jgi:hypothetical protein
MARKNEILNYRTEQAAKGAMTRLLKRYPVHPDCTVEIVPSPFWLYPFQYLIRVTGRDGASGYWSRA